MAAGVHPRIDAEVLGEKMVDRVVRKSRGFPPMHLSGMPRSQKLARKLQKLTRLH